MINPLKAQLHIFQLEGYSPLRFLQWWIGHPFTYITGAKKPLVYTFKAQLLLGVTFLLYLLTLLLALRQPAFFLLLALFLLQPFLLLFLSLLLIKPYELIRRLLTKIWVRRRILGHPHLTVIGITGSYGKTSTKDFLFEILNRHEPTLKTPESFNTVFGIAKVIGLELHRKHRFFICEMGAYQRGEIKELTYMIPPDYALLTAIGPQHLDRFKSLKNTILAKFELLDAVAPDHALANLDNLYIREHLKSPQYRQVNTFSLPQFSLSPTGTSFTLKHQNKNYAFTTSLFGRSNLINLTGAISLALLLQVPIKTIQVAVAALSPSPHRLELKKIGRATLIDNAYSSNVEGFTNIIADLKNLPGKKALITPGIIELGGETASVHQNLGRLAGPVFDRTILVGRSDRTQNLAQGIANDSKITYLDSKASVWPTIENLAKTFDWILLENDLPDNY